MDDNLLKPCLCGNPAELVERGAGWTANCIYHPISAALGKCLACPYDGPSTPLFDTPEEAAANWNKYWGMGINISLFHRIRWNWKTAFYRCRRKV